MITPPPTPVHAPRSEPAPPLVVDPAQTRMVLELKHASPLVGCRIDPTGQWVFAGSQDNSVQRWHLASGKKTGLTGHKSWIRALAFAAREKWLFSGSWDGKLLTWPLDADAPTPLRTIDAHQGWVRALAVHPSGKLLASCGNDRLVKLWSIPEGQLVRAFAGHDSHVYNVQFHPKTPHVVSADLKGILKVWDLNKGTEERTLDAKVLNKYDVTFGAEIGGVRGMAFSGDGGLLACAGITDVSNAFAGIGKPVIVLFDWQSGKAEIPAPAARELPGHHVGHRFPSRRLHPRRRRRQRRRAVVLEAGRRRRRLQAATAGQRPRPRPAPRRQTPRRRLRRRCRAHLRPVAQDVNCASSVTSLARAVIGAWR